ncbi:unnamed protein product [Lathyrus oleraceus]
MEKTDVKVRCQRIGCNATFTDDDNLDDSCQYHESPLFHDGMKEWSCCKKRSHDIQNHKVILNSFYLFHLFKVNILEMNLIVARSI